jgi:holo-[acyl-carrier protein] synthase
MKISTGIDIIEIRRFKRLIERYGSRFIERVFTPLEIAEAGGRAHSLAARFAAKEAVSKALGTGIGLISWQEIEILKGENDAPGLRLLGSAARRAQDLGLADWSVSLSHEQEHAVAMVVAVGGGTG